MPSPLTTLANELTSYHTNSQGRFGHKLIWDAIAKLRELGEAEEHLQALGERRELELFASLMKTDPKHMRGAEQPSPGAALTRTELLSKYVLDSGGPNPFYKCKVCGGLVPGLEEYLGSHSCAAKAPIPSNGRDCPYCTSTSELMRETYFKKGCAGCEARMAKGASTDPKECPCEACVEGRQGKGF